MLPQVPPTEAFFDVGGQHRRNIGKDKMSDITRIGVIAAA